MLDYAKLYITPVFGLFSCKYHTDALFRYAWRSE